MMLEKETFEKFEYYPNDLPPHSNKKILVMCDNCDKTRIVQRNQYFSLCHLCSCRTDKCRKKKSIASKKRWDNHPELKIKRREDMTGERNPNHGVPLSEEHKAILRKARKGKRQYEMTGEIREKMRKAQKGKAKSEAHKKNLSKAHTGKTLSDEHKRKLSEAHKGRKFSEETIKKMCIASKKKWQDPDYVKKVMEGINAKPNKIEQLVDEILQKHFSNEWKYNGDFSCGVTINGLIPDFINVNGKKAVIEVFGTVYHSEKAFKKIFNRELSWKQTEFGKKAIFAQLGYACVVLQERQIKEEGEEYVLNEIRGVLP